MVNIRFIISVNLMLNNNNFFVFVFLRFDVSNGIELVVN